jgi:hypothetical protein
MARRGGGAGRPGRKKALGKKVVYTLISRKDKAGAAMYELLDELVEKHHEHLAGARIALAWHLGWKVDADGCRTLGKCKKASDLDRELARGDNAWDFVIMLDSGWWNNSNVPQKHRIALLDHELCHAQQRVDKNTAEQVEDERGRKLWRTRKHDIEEFSEVVRRHGCWKGELEQFYRDLQQGTRQQELFKDEPGKAAAAKPAAAPGH